MYDTAVDTEEVLMERIIAAFDNAKGRVEELRGATRIKQRRSQGLVVNEGNFGRFYNVFVYLQLISFKNIILM